MSSYIKRQVEWGNRAITGRSYSPAAHLAHFVTQLAVIALVIGGAVLLVRWAFS